VKFALLHPVGERNKIRILNAVATLGKATPKEVKDYLILKNYKLSRERVQYWLGRLTKEGYLRKDGHEYSLTQMILFDNLFMADNYGTKMFSDMIIRFFKEESIVGKLRSLASLYGIFLVYIFLTGLEPFEGMTDERKLLIEKTGSHKLPDKERRSFKARWVKLAVPIYYMYYHFQRAFRLDDSIEPQGIEVPFPNYLDIPMTGKYDLSRDKFNEIMKILERTYPDICKNFGLSESNLYNELSELAKI
jgi:hypothetical protein